MLGACTADVERAVGDPSFTGSDGQAATAPHRTRFRMLRPARTLTVSIAAPASAVYAVMANAARLPEWATGLGTAPTPLPDGAWRIETPTGPMHLAFAPPNAFGVADHVVSPLAGDGPAVDVPLRVVPNGLDGSEVMLTLFRQPGMTDPQFEADAAMIATDLAQLKRLVEREAGAGA